MLLDVLPQPVGRNDVKPRLIAGQIHEHHRYDAIGYRPVNLAELPVPGPARGDLDGPCQDHQRDFGRAVVAGCFCRYQARMVVKLPIAQVLYVCA